MNRRDFVKLLGVAGGGLMLTPLIAACAAEDNSGDQSATAPSSGNSSTTGEATATVSGGSTAGGATATSGDNSGGTGATPKILVAVSERDISNLDPHLRTRLLSRNGPKVQCCTIVWSSTEVTHPN